MSALLTVAQRDAVAATDRLVVACGTGIGTSPFLAAMIEAEIAGSGVTVEFAPAHAPPATAQVVLTRADLVRTVPTVRGRVVLGYHELSPADPTIRAVVEALRSRITS